jgi:hypothetical protein
VTDVTVGLEPVSRYCSIDKAVSRRSEHALAHRDGRSSVVDQRKTVGSCKRRAGMESLHNGDWGDRSFVRLRVGPLPLTLSARWYVGEENALKIPWDVGPVLRRPVVTGA